MAHPRPQPLESGSTFGKWTVVRELAPIRRDDRKANIRMVECRCDCGLVAPVRLVHLRGGRSVGCRSCGHVGKKRRTNGRDPNARYNATNRTYRIYRGMIARCTWPSATGWKRYGARGIDVCQRWRDNYDNFVADMGEAPDGLSIDRIDSDGPYSPENCRWATATEQVLNQKRTMKVPVDGEMVSLKEACQRRGANYGTVRSRLERGIPLQEALVAD